MTRRERRSSDGNPSRSAISPGIEAAATQWFALRDAGLSPEQERSMARWLSEDPRHAQALAQLDAAWSTFGKPERTGEAEHLLVELAGRRSRRRRTRVMAASIALALAIVSLGVFHRPSGADRVAPQSLAVVHSPKQQKLPDGSTVTLREGASIALEFSDAQRRVVLQRGEALFEVQKDSLRPFIVVADGVAVRAVGTAFSVQSGAGAVDVLVTEGVVSIGPASKGGPSGLMASAPGSIDKIDTPAPVTVSAGHRIMVEAAPAARPLQSEAVLPAEIDRRLSWRAPRVELSGMPLVEAVALLNREAAGRTATRLRIADREINSERVSGVFRTDNLEAFLFLLETGFNIKVTRTGDTVTLRKAP